MHNQDLAVSQIAGQLGSNSIGQDEKMGRQARKALAHG